jgi:PHP family Zn ribbon phosphoesterase
MHRVEALADRPEGDTPTGAIPFQHVVALETIIADALSVGVNTQTVEREYLKLIGQCGTEFDVLLKTPEETLRLVTSARIVEGIVRMRSGQVRVEPGYDGEYGTVSLFTDADVVPAASSAEQQLTLF